MSDGEKVQVMDGAPAIANRYFDLRMLAGTPPAAVMDTVRSVVLDETVPSAADGEGEGRGL
jgi:hypothetical protein